MSIPDASIKLVPSGFIAGVQSWSVGFWVVIDQVVAPIGQGELDIVAGDWNALVATWWGVCKASSAVDTDWRKTSLYYYPAGGDNATVVSVSTASGNVPGTGGAPAPTEAAIVQSLRSTNPGRSGRGRVYLPATGQVFQSNHQLTLAQCVTYCTATKNLLTALNAYVSVPADITNATPIVRSDTDSTGYGIVRVVVDSSIDTQRRRGDKIVPAFSSSQFI